VIKKFVSEDGSREMLNIRSEYRESSGLLDKLACY